MSNFLGQLIVEEYGHSASILTSLAVSICPIVLFAFFPETLGDRGRRKSDADASVHTLPIVHIV